MKYLVFILALMLVPVMAHAQDAPTQVSPTVNPPGKPVSPRPDVVHTLDELLDRLSETRSESQAKLLDEEIQARFLASGSASIDLLLQRGMRAQQSGQLALAGDFYADLTELAPDFAAGWNQRATLEFSQGLLQPALEDVGHALALQPRNYVALTNLGEMLERMQQTRAALKAYEDALAIHPFFEAALKGRERLEKAVQGRQL